MAQDDPVYAEVTPVPTNDLEIMKLILVPYQGTIVQHYPERNCALVQLPDLSALDALQQVPTYTTVMVDPPPSKQAQATPRGDAAEKGRSTGPAAAATNEASSAAATRAVGGGGGGKKGGGGEAGEEKKLMEQREDRQQPVEPVCFPVMQEGLTQRKSAAAGGASDSVHS